MPKRIVADHQAAVGQLPEQSAQRQVRFLGDPRQNPIALARHKVGPGGPHLLRRRTAERALALRPLHNAGDADHKRLGHRAAGLTRSRRRNHPALVLGLLVYTAFTVYTTQQAEAQGLGPVVIELDVILEEYGPDASAGGWGCGRRSGAPAGGSLATPRVGRRHIRSRRPERQCIG